MSRQTALMPGNEDKVGYWLTPPDLMAELQAEFDFDFDACPYPRPAGFDGLKEPWGKRTWCNPPWGQRKQKVRGVMAWVRKAIAENVLGCTIVLILSASQLEHATDPLLAAGAEARLIPGVRWTAPDGRTNPRAHPCVLFILRPKL